MSLKRQNFSELKVLKSAAGYYIGRLYWDDEFNFWDNGSRESNYFATEAQATMAFHDGFDIRQCSENELGYSQGWLPKPNEPNEEDI